MFRELLPRQAVDRRDDALDHVLRVHQPGEAFASEQRSERLDYGRVAGVERGQGCRVRAHIADLRLLDRMLDRRRRRGHGRRSGRGIRSGQLRHRLLAGAREVQADSYRARDGQRTGCPCPPGSLFRFHGVNAAVCILSQTRSVRVCSAGAEVRPYS